jgi:hypothetical protein
MPAVFFCIPARWAQGIIHWVLCMQEGVEWWLVMQAFPQSGQVIFLKSPQSWGHCIPLDIIALLASPPESSFCT